MYNIDKQQMSPFGLALAGVKCQSVRALLWVGEREQMQRMGGCGCGCGNEWWPLLPGAAGLGWAGAAALHDRTPQFSILRPVYLQPPPSTTSTIPLPTYFPLPPILR